MAKMKNELFKGACTAVVTPFSGGKIDYDSFEKILEYQLSEGIKNLVICGTTGESSTLSEKEWRSVVRFAAVHCKDRAYIIAGCGTNCTKTTVARVKYADKIGCDAVLCVTPYYNKASKSGLINHYREVSNSTFLPIILYNVPSRTGVDIPIEVYGELDGCDNIKGIKEASGSVSKSAALINRFGDRYSIYSGCDDINLPVLSLGASGVISVTSNIFPAEVNRICELCFEEKYREAARLSNRIYPVSRALFSDVNPIPVKAAMAHFGLCRNELRLPLAPLDGENEEKLIEVIDEAIELL